MKAGRWRLQRGSIYNRFLVLIITIIILPAIFTFTVLSGILIANLSKSDKKVLVMTAETVSNTVEEALNSVLDTSVSLIGNAEVQAYLSGEGGFTTFTRATEVIKNYYLWNHYISQIQIRSIDGQKVINGNNINTIGFTEEEIERLKQTNGVWFWTEDKENIGICRVIRNGLNVKERWGYLKILLDKTKLEQLFRIETMDSDYQFFLYDRREGHIFFSMNENNMEDIEEVLKDNNYREKEFLELKNKIFYKNQTRLRNTDLIIASENQMIYLQWMQIIIIVTIIGLLVVLSYFCFTLYKKQISGPLTTLNNTMLKLYPGKGVPAFVDVEARGEIRQLIDTFNKMSKEIEDLYDRNYKMELKLKDAKIKVLQQEINPHFLYNVLDSIRWMIVLDEKETAAKMIEQLSGMFRMSLQHTENGVVSLAYEMEHAKNYIEIERLRFRDKIQFEINIQDDIEGCYVMKFILQPLLENAVTHGIQPAGRAGKIVLSCYQSSGCLIYDIRDNGVGAEPEYIKDILDGNRMKKNSLEGFALENIQSRLKLKYGLTYGIEYRKREGGGSVFLVKQPLLKGEEEANV